MQSMIEKIGRSVGGVVGKLFQAGRDAVQLCIQTIIPFMAFVAGVIGLILSKKLLFHVFILKQL